jgi:polyhydroxyalkanoate synthesis repressor PhaR
MDSRRTDRRESIVKKAAIVIKKYENRRLYDTSSSRYVNLEDVASMIREGQDVQVVDAKTGEDLTRVILTQIITEDAKLQPTGLPLELLRQLVMATDRAGKEFVMWYLKSAFDAYQKVRDAVQNRLSEVDLSPMRLMSSLIPGTAEGVSSPQPDEPEKVKQLRQRIAELEARIEKHQAPPPARTRKSKGRAAPVKSGGK